MSALGATSPAGSNLAALIAANVPSSPPSNPPPSALADTAAGNDRGPPTNIQLSDKVKSILARAETDQAVADRLNRSSRISAPAAPVARLPRPDRRRTSTRHFSI